MSSTYRITTNGLYRNYRTNLTKNNKKLNDAMTTVQTSRKFNTYAEDPATASKAWRLRRSYWLNGDQIDNNNYLISKYESAHNAMGAIVDGDVGNGEYGLGLEGILSAIEGANGAAGSARAALGKQLVQTSENMVSMMNSKYGDDFIFAGADGDNIPFAWDTADDGTARLLYRGVDVNSKEGTEEYAKLQKMANETNYVDIGLGMKEDDNGKIVTGSAFNGAISGLNFLGYGEDENLAVVVRELGEIYSRTDPETGNYTQAGDAERAEELLNKVHETIRYSQGQHVQLNADAKYLNTNLKQLQQTKDELDNQIVDAEDKDMAEASTEMTWAQYCYNAALRIGTNILSQSLIDYMS